MLALRQEMQLTQSEFWCRIGLTQSAGSRYENGRNISKVVAIALELAWGTEKEAQALLETLRKPVDAEL